MSVVKKFVGTANMHVDDESFHFTNKEKTQASLTVLGPRDRIEVACEYKDNNVWEELPRKQWVQGRRSCFISPHVYKQVIKRMLAEFRMAHGHIQNTAYRADIDG